MVHCLKSRAQTETAVISGDTRRSWSQLNERANRWASLLRSRGFTTGDRLALATFNQIETFEVLLGCLHAGVVVVPVSWRLTVPEITYLLADSGCRMLVADRELAGPAIAAADAAPQPITTLLVGGGQVSGEQDAEFARADGAEPAAECSGGVLLYTSGTTGRPKGVLTGIFEVGAPCEALAATASRLGAAFRVPVGGVALLDGPWYHSAQLFFSVLPLLVGCRVVIRPRFDPEATLRAIDEHGVQLAHFVPTQFIRLLRTDGAVRAGYDGGSLRTVWHGGGACPPAVKRTMIDWWGPVLSEYYGGTECGIASAIGTASWLAHPGSVGRAIAPTEIVIVDDEGRPAPPGVTGTVYVRVPRARDFSYHNDEVKTRAAHRAPGEFTLGDIGHLDEDGYLYLTGRSAELIVSGGVNIYPAEIEGVLLSHPRVQDAAVFGTPDDEFGERVCAAIVLAPESDSDVTAELQRYCRSRLAGFKIPRQFIEVNALPREPTGKLIRSRIADVLPTAARLT
jgi:acyl-CoA synthetase (AMP-forming)/AMP-acid ligase II